MDNIPTRTQIQDKIDEIRGDPAFSTIREDLIMRLAEWLDSLEMPDEIVLFGQLTSPKEKILEDLDSYKNV